MQLERIVRKMLNYLIKGGNSKIILFYMRLKHIYPNMYIPFYVLVLVSLSLRSMYPYHQSQIIFFIFILFIYLISAKLMDTPDRSGIYI